MRTRAKSAEPTFYELCTQAVADFAEHGYDNEHRLELWMARLREAARREMVPEQVMLDKIRESLSAIYRRLVERGSIIARHPDITRFTLERVRPALRSELDRRIMASAKLIRMNRDEAIEKTLRRFAGWATSIPPGGSDVVAKNVVKVDLRKSLSGLNFAERRVAIDQGYKLTSSLNDILARDGGALAVKWNSHWRQANYDYRPDHKERDGKFYALRSNWALERGLMKRGLEPYYDETVAFGQEIFCRCWGTYVHTLRKLPDDMLTVAGRVELDRVRKAA